MRTSVAFFCVFLLTTSGLLLQTLKRARSFTEKSAAFFLFFFLLLLLDLFQGFVNQRLLLLLRYVRVLGPMPIEAASAPFFPRAR